MISVDDLGSPTWAFQRTHYWTLKFKMAEICEVQMIESVNQCNDKI